MRRQVLGRAHIRVNCITEGHTLCTASKYMQICTSVMNNYSRSISLGTGLQVNNAYPMQEMYMKSTLCYFHLRAPLLASVSLITSSTWHFRVTSALASEVALTQTIWEYKSTCEIKLQRRRISAFSTSQCIGINSRTKPMFKCDQHSTYSVWRGERVVTLHTYSIISCMATHPVLSCHLSPSDSHVLWTGLSKCVPTYTIFNSKFPSIMLYISWT